MSKLPSMREPSRKDKRRGEQVANQILERAISLAADVAVGEQFGVEWHDSALKHRDTVALVIGALSTSATDSSVEYLAFTEGTFTFRKNKPRPR